jgi:hypothetical protein
VSPLARVPRACLVAAVLALAGPAGAAAAAASSAPGTPGILTIRTIPRVPRAVFTLAGRRFRADRSGRLQIPIDDPLGVSARLQAPEVRLGPDVVARFKQWHGHLATRSSRSGVVLAKTLTATYDVYYRVRLRFVVAAGRRPQGRVDRIVLRGSTGVVRVLRPQAGAARVRVARSPAGAAGLLEVWLQGRRVVPYHDRLEVKPLYWVVDRVDVDGTNVVNRSQQKLFPHQVVGRIVPVHVLYFSARLRVRDALFHTSTGSQVLVRLPSGKTKRYPLSHGSLVLASLPRGQYDVRAEGAGIAFWTPVALSRDQEIDLRVISYLDIAVLGLALAAVAFGLAAARRPALRRRVTRIGRLPLPSLRR